jgi:hypothetical protein
LENKIAEVDALIEERKAILEAKEAEVAKL